VPGEFRRATAGLTAPQRVPCRLQCTLPDSARPALGSCASRLTAVPCTSAAAAGSARRVRGWRVARVRGTSSCSEPARGGRHSHTNRPRQVAPRRGEPGMPVCAGRRDHPSDTHEIWVRCCTHTDASCPAPSRRPHERTFSLDGLHPRTPPVSMTNADLDRSPPARSHPRPRCASSAPRRYTHRRA